MRVLALNGSPRKGGNTDLLLKEMLRACREQGHKGEILYLYKQEIRPCIDCRKCKKGDFTCPLDDSMQGIYPKLNQADLIVFGTPLYWYGPSGPMKLLMDRIRPYVANRKLEGKKAMVVCPSAEGPSACGPLVEMFRQTCKYLGMIYKGELLVTAYDKGEVKKSPEDLRRAYDLGAGLCR
jgi:multimeric flavodoxin WrbA